MNLVVHVLQLGPLLPRLVPPLLQPPHKERISTLCRPSLPLRHRSPFGRANQVTNQMARLAREIKPTWSFVYSVCTMFPKGQESVVQALYGSQLGPVGPFLPHVRQEPLRDHLKQRFVEDAATWTVHRTLSPFTRRVTAIEWHPVYHNVVAFASHGGDVQLWSYEDQSRSRKIEGLGFGYGCITAMKFHPEKPRYVYTTSVDGRFCLQDMEGRQSNVYLDTQNASYWWCCVDFSRRYNVIFVGDNTGQAVLLDSTGEATICSYKKFHKAKIKHAEFCHAGRWLLATASVDHTVALWDIRMLRSQSSGLCVTRPQPISSLMHEAPVNSATFDPQFGSRLLTTAQNSELRTYDASTAWGSPSTIISHPHRHFQHMTDITATWHPIHRDLCVIGRYPERGDSNQSRSVDLVNVERGVCVGTLECRSLKGIVVLNRFNRFGSCLASGMGYHCILWQPQREVFRQARAEYKGHGVKDSLVPDCPRDQRRGKRKRSDKIDKTNKSKTMSVSKKKRTL